MAKRNPGPGPGRLYLVGTGPGAAEHLTPAARTAIESADCLIGYRTYLELLPPELRGGKEIIASEMMKEVARGRQALELAEQGRVVALISGGDPGIYAMAGLVFELARERGSPAIIEVVPGIAALNACAARLGAPLMHDFAAVSLSDLLTPWELIEKRLQAAAVADFVTVIYNPQSKRRTWQLARAREIFLEERAPETPVGIVTAASRPDEKITLTTLADLEGQEVGMQSTVIIGNSQSYCWNNLLITPRGYGNKYNLESNGA
ncbi:MAG: precorrin-3B C(17)-methyltransferase [Desulfurivibrio sp.]|nr:precorrin-3B C(17)-methyltransferase [Desulfurivibrio sp.]